MTSTSVDGHSWWSLEVAWNAAAKERFFELEAATISKELKKNVGKKQRNLGYYI